MTASFNRAISPKHRRFDQIKWRCVL